jgi:hypothetical protein
LAPGKTAGSGLDYGLGSRVLGGKNTGTEVKGQPDGSKLENQLGLPMPTGPPNNYDEPEQPEPHVDPSQMTGRAGRPGRRQKREDEAQGNSFANFDDMLSSAGGLGAGRRTRREKNKVTAPAETGSQVIGSHADPTETNQTPKKDSMDTAEKKSVLPVIEDEEIVEENEDEYPEDDEDPKNKSEVSPQETKTFFMYKAKSQFNESDKISLAKLKQIKKLHKPMNYNKIRKLGMSYIADMEIKTMKKQEELKEDL